MAAVAVGPHSAVYGTTLSGGFSSYGTVFVLAPPSEPGGPWTESILYNFSGDADGNGPIAPLTIRNGALYGTTIDGGTPPGDRTVFELKPGSGGSWVETVLHSFFCCGNDGANPEARVLFDAQGSLYSTPARGGGSAFCETGCGTIFKLAPPSTGADWTETLHNFSGFRKDSGDPQTGFVLGAGGTHGTTADQISW